MPPAKIVFEIIDGPGFFKDADKGDIYYTWVDTEYDPGYEGIAYTNPFYEEMIPSSPFIPPFNINGGVDWDSWDYNKYGPYPFWQIFNQLPGMTPDDPQHPTKVEVYSDNHGEAMVWLNGDWNLDLSDWVGGGGGYDIPTGTTVGQTEVKVIADYPYFRADMPIIRKDPVVKTWTWGKSILGADPEVWDTFDTYMVFQVGDLTVNEEKMAFIWVSNRDGFPPVGEKIEWWLAPGGAEIRDITTAHGVSTYLPDINVKHGFLVGTLISPKGEVGGANPARDRGVSFTRLPTDAEKALFEKFQDPAIGGVWPAELDVNDYAVAAIYVQSSLETVFDLTITLHEREGAITRHTNLNFIEGNQDALDDPRASAVSKTGDVTGNGIVDIFDMIQVVQKFGQTGPEDVNQDGVINVLDLILVGQNFD